MDLGSVRRAPSTVLCHLPLTIVDTTRTYVDKKVTGACMGLVIFPLYTISLFSLFGSYSVNHVGKLGHNRWS